MDTLWIVTCAILVFFMQLGFSLVEAGTVKFKNVQNILYKNVLDMCIGAICWYVFGYSVAYGDTNSKYTNSFMGIENMFLENKDYKDWFFQWSFSITAGTIISGGVAERVTLEGYFLFTIIMNIWIYPITAHWVWSSNGFLSATNMDNKFLFGGIIDLAGCSAVHIVGGFSGLIGSILLGPRIQRFSKIKNNKKNKGNDKQLQKIEKLQHEYTFGNDVSYQVIGMLILWFGWYGFNAGSLLKSNGYMVIGSRIIVNTTLSGCTGGITTAILSKLYTKYCDEYKHGYFSLTYTLNGVLSGLVSITGSCHIVSIWSSIIIGFIGGTVYMGVSILIEYCKIDDPLDVFAIHGAGGLWGLLGILFGNRKYIEEFGGYNRSVINSNIFERFIGQFFGAIIIIIWTVVNAYAMFKLLMYCNIFRLTSEAEKKGLDKSYHGGPALHYDANLYDIKAYDIIASKPKNKDNINSNDNELTIDIDSDAGESKLASRIKNTSLEIVQELEMLENGK